MDQPSKEEKGILSTLVLIYTKTRNTVKFEELKVLQATLGIYTYSLSEDRAQQLRYHRQLVEIGDEIKESAGKIIEPLN